MQTPSFLNDPAVHSVQKRLLSLDVMRGVIMILLAAESCLLYESLHKLQPGITGTAIVKQFFHHPWNGLRFWDLVQPAFMMMAGTSLYLSSYSKLQKGKSWQQNFKHVAIRCIKLFICGTLLHCIYAGRMVWELWNVLTQLSITTLIAYAIINKTMAVQIAGSVFLLLLTEVLYRFVLMPGFDQPFIEHKNFGAWFDIVLMGKINSDGWVAVNFIPTAVHTIAGVLVGKLLLRPATENKKIQLLLIAAAITLTTGYLLEIVNITPIIKRISTSSFVLVSLGWVLLIMAFLYWLTDIKKMNKYAWLFVVTGTNAIFIYLFFETVGIQWLNNTTGIFVKGFTGLFSMPANMQAVVTALGTLFVEWYLCMWLYKKKIFFKL